MLHLSVSIINSPREAACVFLRLLKPLLYYVCSVTSYTTSQVTIVKCTRKRSADRKKNNYTFYKHYPVHIMIRVPSSIIWSVSRASLSKQWRHSLMSSTTSRTGNNRDVILRAWSRSLATTQTSRTVPWITANPRICMHDVPTILKAGGFKPNTLITLAASVMDENNKQVSL